MLLLLALSCSDPGADKPDSEGAIGDSPIADDSAGGPQSWADPIARVNEVDVDTDRMELTDVVLAGDRLALLGQHQSAEGGLWLMDRSDPAAPSFLGKTELWHVQAGCWDGELLWGVDRYSSLRSFDIGGELPEILHTEAIGGPDGDVDCAPGRLAWGRGSAGGWVARTADAKPEDIQALGEPTLGVLLDGDLLWTSSTEAVLVWRWVDGQAPELLHRVEVEGVCRDLARSETLIAAACGASGVMLISRDADEPELLGQWRGYASARAVALDGDTLWVAGWADLLAFDVSDPSAPAFIGAEGAGSSVMGVAAEGGLAYAADWNRPFIARLDGGAAPELRASPGVPYPGERVALINDGTAPLWVDSVSHGELTPQAVVPGGTLSWALPESLTAAEVWVRSDDPDEPELRLRVASLGMLEVGASPPELFEEDTQGNLYTTEALRGEIVFLGLFSDG